jgi:hypothetical protein
MNDQYSPPLPPENNRTLSLSDLLWSVCRALTKPVLCRSGVFATVASARAADRSDLPLTAVRLAVIGLSEVT